MLTSRGLGRVLGDLASMGFDARWGVLGAADIGAPHQRDRIWIVAQQHRQLSHTQHDRIRRWEQQSQGIEEKNPNVENTRHRSGWDKRTSEGRQNPQGKWATNPNQIGRSSWWQAEPDVGRVADGVAARMDRLKSIGNGQVPLCAATAWRILNDQK